MNSRSILIVAAVLFIWILIVQNTVALIREGTVQNSRTPSFKEDQAMSATFALIEKALRNDSLPPPPDYSGSFENPFRPLGKIKQIQRSRRPQRNYNRQKLFLKGLLLKEKPLAIIEDQHGQTYIAGAGETILDQKIQAIKGNRVVLRDALGTYELTVED